MYTGYQVHIARNICCNVIENTIRGHTPYCASEICHFRLMEENISNNRDIWTENTLKQAMAGLLHVSAGAPFILGSLSLPPRICANVAWVLAAAASAAVFVCFYQQTVSGMACHEHFHRHRGSTKVIAHIKTRAHTLS
jgi:hypothetical protein